MISEKNNSGTTQVDQQHTLISIVILNWNNWRQTLECISSVKAIDYAPFAIIVVDNGSTDGSEQKIRNAHPDITVIQTGSNLGYAAGNNFGLRRALEDGADYVWLLNNDVVVDSRALTQLFKRMISDSRIGICGSTVVYYDDNKLVQALGGGWYNFWLGTSGHIGDGRSLSSVRAEEEQIVERRLAYVVGASMLVSRRFIVDIGFMNESYFLYFEEIDWVTRAKGRYCLGYASQSLVFHREGATTGASNRAKRHKSAVADYHTIRSRLIYTKKYRPYALPSVYCGLVVTIINRGMRGQWNRVPMILKLMLSIGAL